MISFHRVSIQPVLRRHGTTDVSQNTDNNIQRRVYLVVRELRVRACKMRVSMR